MVWFITLRTSFFLVLLIVMIYCNPGLGHLSQENSKCVDETAATDGNNADSQPIQNTTNNKSNGVIMLANFKAEGLKSPDSGNADAGASQNCYEDETDASQLALYDGKSIQSLDFLEFPSTGFSEIK